MSEQPVTVVVMRIEDSPLPAVPSAEVRCDMCLQPCWLGYDLFPKLDGTEHTIKCMYCIVPDLIATEKPEFESAFGKVPDDFGQALAEWTIKKFGV